MKEQSVIRADIVVQENGCTVHNAKCYAYMNQSELEAVEDKVTVVVAVSDDQLVVKLVDAGRV